MEATSGPSSLCPVCSVNQSNLPEHLASHSKEEIILALSSPNRGSLQDINHDIGYRKSQPQTNNAFNNENNVTLNGLNSVNHAIGLPAQNGSDIGNSFLTVPPILPYHSPLSVHSPFVSGMKNNHSNVNTSPVVPTRAAYIQNGATQIAFSPPQVPSHPVSIVYRHPPLSQNQSTVDPNNPSVSVHSSQLSDTPLTAVRMTPYANHSEVSSSASNHAINSRDNVQNITIPAKVNSNVINLSSGHGNFITTSVPVSSQGHPLLCILPFTPVQQTIPSGNYILYNSSLLPGNNVVTDNGPLQPQQQQQQQHSVNYVSGNGNQNLSLPTPQSSNQLYYLSCNKIMTENKQTSPSAHHNNSASYPSASLGDNFAQTVSPLPNQTTFRPANNKTSDNITDSSSHRISSQENCDNENATTIEVGNNIKISIPKDVLGKKERLKELINKELVRGILINDSIDMISSQESKSQQSREELKYKSHGKGKSSGTCKSSKNLSSNENMTSLNQTYDNDINSKNNTSNGNDAQYIDMSTVHADHSILKVNYKPIRTMTSSCIESNVGYSGLNNTHNGHGTIAQGREYPKTPMKTASGNNTQYIDLNRIHSDHLDSSLKSETARKVFKSVASTCNETNTQGIEMDRIHHDQHTLSLSKNSENEDPQCCISTSLPGISKYTDSSAGAKTCNTFGKHSKVNMSSYVDGILSNEKSCLKMEDRPVVGTSRFRYKTENETLAQSEFSNIPFNLFSPEKSLGFLGDEVFSDIAYEEEQVLGAVEEVFASENSINSTPIECKDQPKLSDSIAFDMANTGVNFENQIVSHNSENDMQLHTFKEEEEEPLHTKKAFKYAKTYYRVRKSIPTPNKVSVTYSSSESFLGPWIAETSQISNEIQNPPEAGNNNLEDDHLHKSAEMTSETDAEFSDPVESPLKEDEYTSDFKDCVSFEHEVSMKIENGESNGTLGEEILSLKASETLADSDSESPTPTDEVEVYYGKSCMFAGEPGPPNLSSQEFSSIEEPSQVLSQAENEDFTSINSSTAVRVNLSVNAVREHRENANDDTISLTLDANCSILPADTLPQLLGENPTDDLSKETFLKDDLWTKPMIRSWSKQNEAKTFVTTGIVESYSSITSLASTSGLQSFDVSGLVKKNARDDEEYDFEYESDCYGDSDSDIGHHHRGLLDLERWRCAKCNKTFKSLKEKLLHSGHHSPCILGKGPARKELNSLSKQGQLLPVEKSNETSQSTPLKAKSENPVVPPVKDSVKYSKINTRSVKGKKKKQLRKLKVKKEDCVENNTEVCADTSDNKFKCSECSQLFPTVEKLHNHRAAAFRSRFICPVCHVVFRKRMGKLRHLKIHPISELKCSICYRNFDSFYAFSQHHLFHMGRIMYECKECGHKCQRKGELDIHYRKHSGEKPYKCETCKNSFVSNHSLKRHLIVHMKGQEVECDVCHKRYKNSLGLAKHKQKVHSKKKKFIKKRSDFMCEVCNEVFLSEKKLAWHKETHERWPKKCQSCGECFIHQSNLTKHIRMKHDPNFIPSGSDKDTVFCSVCKKAYKRSSISLHMRIHTGVKPFKCNVCNKEFTVKCNYLSHKWTHTGIRDRPFKCKYCERSFHIKRFLEVHIRSHKKIRPFTCNDCGKSFTYKSNYQTHVKLHTEDKKHECNYCGKTFFRKYNLHNHVRIHTGETPYECTICRKEFTQKSNYNVHMKAFHVERHTIHEEV